MTTSRILFLRQLPAASAAVLLAAGLSGCASERRSVVGHAYDNVVARDNAYFLAREKLLATEDALYKARVNDYNRVLPLLPTLDDAAVAKVTADLDDVIKKASLPIQHRPGSDWTDDSYLLIGKARYYKKEFEDAAKTFKYINTTTQDPNAKHESLIWLMRTFLATKELDNAKAVSDVLDKEQGVPRNARELFLTRAAYHLQLNEPEKAIENLERALPYIEPKNEKSRTRYILAQLYQAQGRDKEAYVHLDEILKRNPPYELDFFSKLMLGQVSDLNQNDRVRLDKYFTKLLKNPNNKEYRDKIYYEMGRLEYRRADLAQALALLQKSVRTPGASQVQKSYAYLLTGRIYYENLQKYRLAAAYYDSTVQALPREAPEYAAIAERAATLKDFAQQITIIETQDSLQALARLDTATLRTRLTAYAQAELDAKRREAERLAAQQAREEERSRQAAVPAGINAARDGQPDLDATAFAEMNTGAKWYFDNPTSLGTARSEFIRRWGDRPLQDNWRTVSQVSNSPVTAQGGNVPVSIAGNTSTVVNGGAAAAAPPPDPAAQLRTLVEQYRQNVPLTPALLQTSNLQTEEALYALGGIYKQQLREPVRAAETYERLLTRFPQGRHTPEALYILYLIYKEQNDTPKAEGYAQRLREAYPNSSYARLVADPEYLRRTSAVNAQVAALVDSAFIFYKQQEFKKSAAVLARARRQYPENDFNDRVAFLNALLTIRTQPPLTAKAAVEKFYKDYPQSPLAPQAASLLSTYQQQEQGQITGALASTDKPVISMFRPGEVDNRLRIFYGENESPAAPVAQAPPAPAPTAAPGAPTTGNPAPAAASPTPTPTAAPPATPDAPPASTPAPATPPVASPAPPVVDEAKAARMAAAQARARGKKPAPAPRKPAATPAPTEAAPVASTPPAANPAPKPVPASTPASTPAASAPATAATPAPAAPASAVPAVPYKTNLSAPHVVVLVLAKDAAVLPSLPGQLTSYNGRYFKANNLQVRQQSLGSAQELVVVEPFAGSKVAQSYALKLRGPQSPLSKLRGAGYQTLLISIDNLPLLLQSGDLDAYQRFYQQQYR
ncbi:type IX secretion system periplasmic lipoprotein PorW/SprE [Hymenobacter weizhouensis]|uniref:type IX secretion system periplasmic lipoprotein PorW/SprE n=1 Tax=Hymenobacter sp. YIM 151500-1 TaxID=2987689 RepID=UPI002226E3B5|nr:tetratricopeptide repeat protein [Hymenobacter sp. YIM 151500-1]UYZ61916.1 tetratricopeptide repeat protein [Hymenobacter sp. YIM 151500-1]